MDAVYTMFRHIADHRSNFLCLGMAVRKARSIYLGILLIMRFITLEVSGFWGGLWVELLELDVMGWDMVGA